MFLIAKETKHGPWLSILVAVKTYKTIKQGAVWDIARKSRQWLVIVLMFRSRSRSRQDFHQREAYKTIMWCSFLWQNDEIEKYTASIRAYFMFENVFKYTFYFLKEPSLPRGSKNKAGYTATLVVCGWAGAVLEKLTRASELEQYAQKAQKRQKSKKGTDRPTDRPTNGPT